MCWSGILLIISWSAVQGIPFYDFSCPFTFEPETSSIFVVEQIAPLSCSWTFQAGSQHTFQLVIHQMYVEGEEDNCTGNSIWAEDDLDRTTLDPLFEYSCDNLTSEMTVETTGSVLHISYITVSQPVTFHASVKMVNKAVRYDIIKEKRSWRDANKYCHKNGGMLAVTYPVVTTTMADIMYSRKGRGKFWIGKSVSPWILQLGCIVWNDNITYYDNMISKYNQLSECSQYCLGSTVILLQNMTCYCVNESVKMEATYSEDCNMPCPGKPTEMCGGVTSLSQYQYYTTSVDDEDTDQHCVKLAYQRYTAEHCSEEHGFTCRILNDTGDTFSEHFEVLSWQEAVAFCDQQFDSRGLAPIPVFPSNYNGEPFWTTVIRSRDWNHPSVIKRKPKFAYMARRDVHGLYKEVLRESSEKSSFICQYAVPSCVGLEMVNQTFMSPDHPNMYPSGQHCEWTVSVDSDKSVYIQFVLLDIEPSRHCIYDYLEIDDGTKASRFCGSEVPVSMVTSSNHVVFRFHSDETVTGAGFELNWEPGISASFDKSHEGENGISGAEAAMLCVFLILLFVVVLALVAFKLCERRRKRKVDLTTVVSSSVNNFLYDDSTFNDTSNIQATPEDTYRNITDKEHAYENTPEEAHVEDKSANDNLVTNNNTSDGACKTTDDTVNRTPAYPGGIEHLLGSEGTSMKASVEKVRCTSEWTKFKIDLRPGQTSSTILTLEDIERMGTDTINVTSVDTVAAVKEAGKHCNVSDEEGNVKQKDDDNTDDNFIEYQAPHDPHTFGVDINDSSVPQSQTQTNEIGDATYIPTPYSNSDKMSDNTVYTDIDHDSKPNNAYTEIDFDNKKVVETKPSNVYTEIDDVTKTACGPKTSNAYAEICDVEDKDGYLIPHAKLENKPSFHAYADVKEVLETEL